MDKDLRCDNGILFGKLVGDGLFEVKCRSQRCGYVRGLSVVLHRFDVKSGELVQTLMFREAPKPTHTNSALEGAMR